MSTDGILNLDKPPQLTSFAAVAWIRKICQQRRVGHAGTLDPMASGVLPICLGRATRLVEYLHDTAKAYTAEIELGKATDTYDAWGQVTYLGDYTAVTSTLLEDTLSSLQGNIEQRPPPYSALKLAGKRLYELARSGVQVEPRPREAQVYRLHILDWQPPRLKLEIECGKGTYIRSLAHELGGRLGCGAHLRQLIRTRYGPFHLADAVTLDQAANAFSQGQGRCLIHPLEAALLHLPAVAVDEEQEHLLGHGRAIALASPISGGSARAYSRGGSLLAVLRFQVATGLWHPRKVFPQV